MPIYETACMDETCDQYAKIEERYYPSSESTPPTCPSCGATHKRLISTFGVVWCKPMQSYNDKTKEGAHLDGHWVTRVRSSRNPDGSPEREWIDTFDKQKQFCKDEKLINPRDLGPVEGSSDGKMNSSRGIPGSW